MNEYLMPIEKRSFSFDIQATENDRGNIIVGRPIVYGQRTNIGLFDEIIEQGALDAADLKDVRFIINHDLTRIPLARSRNNNNGKSSTMHLDVDEKGMKIEVLLDTERNSEARALYSAVDRGDISGMSFWLMVAKGGDKWDNVRSDHPLRHVNKIIRVVEVSAVSFPAYEGTEIDVRSTDEKALENAKRVLENARSLHKKSVETDKDNTELSLLKEKTKILGGIF